MLTELERIIEYRRHVGRLDPIDVQPLAIPEVRLTVLEAPVPAEVPAHLADAVVWVDEHADWRLRRLDVRSIEAYLAWRATWESSFTLGTIRSLRELERSVERLGVTGSPEGAAVLTRLAAGAEHGDVDVDRAGLVAFRSLLGTFAERVRAAQTTGVALVESSPTIQRTGLLRSWPSVVAEGELASRGTVTVRFSGGRIGIWYADERDPVEHVTSFELGIDGAVVVDGDGVTHTLDLDATDALCAVAPTATAWRVRRVPEVLVWADLLAAIEMVDESMRRHGRSARIHLGDVRHETLAIAH